MADLAPPALPLVRRAGRPGLAWRPGQAWLLGIVAWAVAAGGVAIMVHASLTGSARMVDLHVYRVAGQNVLAGRPVYTSLTNGVLLFTYPPAAAALAVPLAWMSWGTAQLAWLAVVYLPLAVTIWYAFRPLLARAAAMAPVAFAAIYLLCAYLMPMREQVHYGQVGVLLMALCTVDCAARRPRWPRGALIGLAAAIKLTPGIFIVYLLVTGRRRAASVAVLSMAAWTAAAYLVIPGDSAFYWTRAIFSSSRLGANAQTANQSLRGSLLRLFLPSAAPAALWLALAVIVGIGCLVAAQSAWRGGHEIAGVAITGLLAVLVSPVSWIHHIVWIVVALGAIVGDGRDRRRLLTAAVTAVFFLTDVPFMGKDLLRAGNVPDLLARVVQDAFCVGALVLVVILARLRPTGADRLVPPAGGGTGPCDTLERVPLAPRDVQAGRGQG